MTRAILLLLLSAPLYAQTLDDVARQLARNISARLAPNEIAHVTTHNQSSLPRTDALHAQSTFEQAMHRRIRNPVTVELTFTISENLKGYLFVADFDRGEDRIVEMVPYRPEPALAPARPALTVTKKMVWEQPSPILDLVLIADSASPIDHMLVLDPHGVTRYERHESKWIAGDSAPIQLANAPISGSRDPRGRVAIDADSFAAEVAGVICHGSIKPPLALTCEPGGEFSAGRNTVQLNASDPSRDASPSNQSLEQASFFSEARIGAARIVAETDGHVRVYDATGAVSRVIDDWGSDLAAVNTCAGSRVIVTTGVPIAPAPISASSAVTPDRDLHDSATLYDFVHSVPIRVSEPVEFPGPVTALWPSRDGALAVAHNLAAGTYEAYSLSADCGH